MEFWATINSTRRSIWQIFKTEMQLTRVLNFSLSLFVRFTAFRHWCDASDVELNELFVYILLARLNFSLTLNVMQARFHFSSLLLNGCVTLLHLVCELLSAALKDKDLTRLTADKKIKETRAECLHNSVVNPWITEKGDIEWICCSVFCCVIKRSFITFCTKKLCNLTIDENVSIKSPRACN